MSSIIQGYSYDIFISYRQNDNKYDGWVTEFVDNLNKELEATIKAKISVYFDINPHDGLLETHSVDRSLEEKLKCLILIPVISQTYCDSNSFAWQHEFCAFNKFAKEDLLGRDIRLPSGNVASRILPIKIHDLDPEDKSILEDELGGVLRSIEFIYKSAGVNRPLRANEDHPKDNLNQTYYRDQINKVANAVKEIINTLKKPQNKTTEDSREIKMPKIELSISLKAKILAGCLLVLALTIIGYLFISKEIASNIQVEKSIAVLPFINDSPDQENAYFINGIMDEILNNLQRIKDFRVLSRTSTEQYRGSNRPTVPKISKELGVNYIVEGSGQKYGNKFVLRVQLIAGKKERHLWSKSYEQEIQATTDIIKVQSEIAKSIGTELKATITPEEKYLIEKIPTTNLTAYDFYQRGREEEGKSSYYDITASTTYLTSNKSSSVQAFDRAEKMYETALIYDSAFAQAYIGLAGIYLNKNYNKEYFSKNFLDSALILANKALSYDNQLYDAYYIRGKYYGGKGIINQAIEEYGKAINLNPNYWLAYFGKGNLYFHEDDYVMALKNFQKVVTLYHGSGLSDVLRRISGTLNSAGFSDLGETYNLEAAKLETFDSSNYFLSLYWKEGDSPKGFEYLKKGYSADSTNNLILERLATYYSDSGKFEESLKFFKKYFERLEAEGITRINEMHRIAYVYAKIGMKDSSKHYFNKQIQYCNDAIKLGRPYGNCYAYYDLAGVYAFLGNNNMAYENLNLFNKRQRMPNWLVTFFDNDPLFESIRDEQDFQKIKKDVEAKYLAEHEQVRKWLEEQGKL
jgi:TolB-like protein